MKKLLLAVLIGLAACSRETTTQTVQKPSPTTEPTTTAPVLSGTCLPAQEPFSDIPPNQIRPANHILMNIRSSVLRVVGVPGPGRTNCGAATGIVLERKNEQVLIAIAGSLAANATYFWVDHHQAIVLGKSTNPPLVIMRVQCEICRETTAIRITTKKPFMPTIAGITNGNLEIVGHPAEIPDQPYVFAGIGPIETWVYTLVPQAATSGDGIWEKDGRLIGVAYTEEADRKNTSVHRLVYIPASDLIILAKAATEIKERK